MDQLYSKLVAEAAAFRWEAVSAEVPRLAEPMETRMSRAVYRYTFDEQTSLGDLDSADCTQSAGGDGGNAGGVGTGGSANTATGSVSRIGNISV